MTSRLRPVEVAVDVELQQNRGMIGRPTRRLRINARKTKIPQIQCLDKGIDHANRIVLIDKIIKAFGKKSPLISVNALNKTLHGCPRKIPRES
jgi:hypothetical protein